MYKFFWQKNTSVLVQECFFDEKVVICTLVRMYFRGNCHGQGGVRIYYIFANYANIYEQK